MVDREFYKQEYKLKVEFYTGQFQRMWTRFNLFLTLETGLAALLFVKDSGALTRLAAPVALVEILISSVWFVIGLQDRCLVRVYRAHIRHAASVLTDLNVVLPGYRHVGEVDDMRGVMLQTSVEEKRWLDRLELRAYFHVTRLAYLFPAFALLLWLVVAIVALTHQA